MTGRPASRRRFLKASTMAAGAAALGTAMGRASDVNGTRVHIACNQYPWTTFFGREGRDFNADIGGSIALVAQSGADGYEPLAESPSDIDRLAPALRKNNLSMRSLYVNSVLHDATAAEASAQRVMAIAQRAHEQLGTRIIVTNPSPIRWGGEQSKTDKQLKSQAKALNQLGERLRSKGLTLAYHNHDVELLHAAREFHHMLVGTDPQCVRLCLDAHWVYRGSGDSSVALFDVVKMYGHRITELHLRQSQNGVWTEAFGDGDIDYRALADQLLGIGVKPHLVLEQAVEEGTPKTMDAVSAHQQGLRYAAEVFARFAA